MGGLNIVLKNYLMKFDSLILQSNNEKDRDFGKCGNDQRTVSIAIKASNNLNSRQAQRAESGKNSNLNQFYKGK